MDNQCKDSNTESSDNPISCESAKSKLDTAMQKIGALTEKAKQHDFKGDAAKAAESAKALKESLKKHDFKAELKEAFAEAKKSPASIWKKPETPRPGKELAVAGIIAAVVLFILSSLFSGAFFGFVFLVLSVAALLLGILGLKTEGRKLAIAGSLVSIFVVLGSFGKMFGVGEGGGNGIGFGKGDKEYPLLVANEGEESSNVDAILANAENADRIKSLNFCGFYTGMSYMDAKAMRKHYGLDKDDVWIMFNKQNGEVFMFKFTPRALCLIMDAANNLDTIEMEIQERLGIVSWNNEKDIVEGEIESYYQDEGDKVWFGDKADVARWYKTADGVLLKVYPQAWTKTYKVGMSIWDPERGKIGENFNRRFDNNRKMREERLALKKKGVETRMLKLPRDFEILFKKSDEDSDCGGFVVAFPFTRELYAAIFGNPDKKGNVFDDIIEAETPKESINRNLAAKLEKSLDDFSGKVSEVFKAWFVIPSENEVRFLAFPENVPLDFLEKYAEDRARADAPRILAEQKEQAWTEHKAMTRKMGSSGKTYEEIKAAGYGLRYDEFERKYESGESLSAMIESIKNKIMEKYKTAATAEQSKPEAGKKTELTKREIEKLEEEFGNDTAAGKLRFEVLELETKPIELEAEGASDTEINEAKTQYEEAKKKLDEYKTAWLAKRGVTVVEGRYFKKAK